MIFRIDLNTFLLMVGLLLTSCGFSWPSRLDDLPAPTTIPLAEMALAAQIPGLAAPQESVNLPPGFAIGVYAQGLQRPRMLAIGPDGQLYVTEIGGGRVLRLPDRDGDGILDGVEVVAQGLDKPSGIAFYRDGSLYIALTDRILRLSEPDTAGFFQKTETIVSNLPPGGNHITRTLAFSPDWSYLYVAIGSSCNVCQEDDARRAAVIRYNPDGSGEMIYAVGMRNAVGMNFRPGTNELWATNNGRDMLGDDLPPETVYIVQEGGDYGWPRCHSGRIVDPDFGEPGACQGVLAPAVEMQAHSAPLGMTFYTGDQFPEEFQGDLFVAFHGSWNRSDPTGYKLVRIPIENGTPGAVQDFALGWLREDGSQWGRPVDVITGTDGSLFISDDGQGLIYKISFFGQE